jgi:hypothetical protein
MREKMRVWRGKDGWLVTTDSPETKRLFGTDTLPTPFTLAADGESVVNEIRRLNPDADVQLRR